MSTYNKPHNTELPKRYPEGEQGDFYSIHGACITCGAPEAEAPDLIAHSTNEWGHCYFKKQPKTTEELDRAINALAVSCIAGIRYGGKDEKILNRLHQLGLEEECDHKPVVLYKMIARNKVTFKYNDTIKRLYDELTSKLLERNPHMFKIYNNYKINNKDNFEFAYRCANDLKGIIFKCNLDATRNYTIEMFNEKGPDLDIDSFWTIDLHSMIIKDKNISEIVWFDIEGKSYHSDEITNWYNT